ncbi:MAG: hypothetical protein EPO55_23125 [Reyranella sp.]|uniref:hypothetical protein n=1 Tax=Reyranella sp. TaxID=1929291 RepID=UPI00120EEFD3|nr:hypothetical protein [Reyranella sp.]TAJ36085.1 MAG: hypothetical protein EPO55_23125 [Reyranella sp.]
MAKSFLMSIAIGALLAAASSMASRAHANDRELLLVLDRNACVPERIVPTQLSAALIVYAVTCKRPARVLHVICIGSECRLQTSPRENDEQ